MKKIFALSFSLLAGYTAAAQNYAPVTLTGFTADVVANGQGSAASSTTHDVDGGSFSFVAANFVNPSGQSPASALPVNGTINSAVAATSGLSFQLAPYTGNNALRISGTGNGTLTFAAPVSADRVYVLATSGSGVSSVTMTVNFTDGTSEAFTQSVSDWFNGTNFAIQGISRVNRTNSGIENSTTNPRLYQVQLTLGAANVGKPIQSITFAKTTTTGVLNVMGASVRLVTSTVPNDVGITGMSAPESGCGLTNQETVTITIQNYGMNAQSNFPVSYSINGAAPVTETFAGPLAPGTAATYSFTTPADLSALGTYNFVARTNLTGDAVPGNDSVTKVVVVNQAPPVPTISAVGPTTFCAGSFVTLSASSPASGVAYQWRLDNSPIAGVSAPIYAAGAAGNYTAVAIANGCSSAPSAITTLTSTPAPVVPIISATGPTSLCSGETVTLTATTITPGATFQWLREGTSIPGANTPSLTTGTAGAYRVLATANGCTSSQSQLTQVSVSQTPVTPTITQSGNTLISSSGIGNQWYKDGVLISGANGSSYNATASGTYTTIITEGACSSDTSNAIVVIVTAMADNLLQSKLNVYPNPGTGVFYVELSGTAEATVTVTDLAGRLVRSQKMAGAQAVLDLSSMAKGAYVLTVATPEGVAVKKLMLE